MGGPGASIPFCFDIILFDLVDRLYVILCNHNLLAPHMGTSQGDTLTKAPHILCQSPVPLLQKLNVVISEYDDVPSFIAFALVVEVFPRTSVSQPTPEQLNTSPTRLIHHRSHHPLHRSTSSVMGTIGSVRTDPLKLGLRHPTLTRVRPTPSHPNPVLPIKT